ncbi:SDR family oxidoreductase [Nonomuraea fastidiosa]|jgi:NAD(P)-dependent dehydrogenase (short-subunit alcohol dehydrogenase family)|uniref:SDR family oxidoreductase n=1 Tax=Nonomuraea TaxID=83681 RepID=UPI00344A423F
MDLQLSGRVAVVTGASKGIGLAVTRTLLSEGTRIVAASRKSTPELDALSGAADIIAAAIGADRDSVLDKAAPEMMKPVTGRLIAPQEVADVIALLASPRSAGTTGADFAVDGGLLKQI